MKLDIDIIKDPIDKHLDEFDRQFKASMKSSVPLLDIITRYIVKRKGKQIRPMFVSSLLNYAEELRNQLTVLQRLLSFFILPH